MSPHCFLRTISFTTKNCYISFYLNTLLVNFKFSIFYHEFQRIDAELKVLDEKHEAYVREVSEGKDHIQQKSFVEERYFDRKPAARIVMSQPDKLRRGNWTFQNCRFIFTVTNYVMMAPI